MARDFGLPMPGGLRTPLEVIDLGADMLNRAFTLPGQVASQTGQAAARSSDSLGRDIESPRVQTERPIPPAVLVRPVLAGVGHIVSGVIDTAKSAVDAVVDNVEGARQELESFIK